MGKVDSVTKTFLRDNEVFADAFNYLIYEGEQIILPEQLHQMDTTVIANIGEEKNKSALVQKVRDVYKYISAMTDGNHAYLILGIESQKDICYAMPARNMLYDAMEYATQISTIAKKHRKDKDASENRADFTSGFRKDDKLIPVITLVIYFGADHWDGPLCIHDMLNTTDKQILSLVENYNIHLITAENLTKKDLMKFKSKLGDVLEYIKCSNNEEQMQLLREEERFTNMSYEAAQLLSTCLGIKLDNSLKEGETVNMCKAWDDHWESGRKIGQKEERMLSVKKLMIKLNLNVENAMEILEIPKEQQADIVKLIQVNG